MPACFVVMPITTPAHLVDQYGGDEEHFTHVFEHLFKPAIEGAGFEARSPVTQGSELIHAEIIKNLEDADLVLCDMSTLNANVFFELGIRTALDRPVSLVCDDRTPNVPFDTGIINFYRYSSGLQPWTLSGEQGKLRDHISASLPSEKKNNALWRHFGITQRARDAADTVDVSPEESTLSLVLSEVHALRSAVQELTPPTAAQIKFEQLEAARRRVTSRLLDTIVTETRLYLEQITAGDSGLHAHAKVELSQAQWRDLIRIAIEFKTPITIHTPTQAFYFPPDATQPFAAEPLVEAEVSEPG